MFLLKTVLRLARQILLISGSRIISVRFCDRYIYLDINLMAFATWSILESDVLCKSYSRVAALKNAFVATWSALVEEVVHRSCHSVSSNLNLVVKANGIHYEIRLL